MSYSYNTLSDIDANNLESTVEEEAKLFSGSLVFRGRNYSDWYALAFDAYESWFGGDDWGRLFEKIAEKLEELQHARDVRMLGADGDEEDE